MGKTFALLGVALIAVCALWLWLSLRKYAARKQREEERATAFMAQAIKAAKKPDDGAGTN
ncbi:MAG: hypothetical protein A2Z64_00015 [Betaproteobacteria bacterium RIFCSPLOWO2_02_67_12]|nr:MAG: hypothetical protein A2Z64_00015 [Betaproteobacteria bacterium RIFCSPLOWO2_02_67_12]OGA27240.1 MAG: hypothetical protein A3I65_04065 [Betaproteobacteria bacterium RIFCSPLOWO2_02_FULL_68_150]OGA69610.1 MAG: hypothetical protein A3F77_06880 [Betaproteobacteria bacterium RIFCSPLOWO2_12_FULL_67_28]